MSSDLIKAIARCRELQAQRKDVHPTKLARWAHDFCDAQWTAMGLFIKEYLGG